MFVVGSFVAGVGGYRSSDGGGADGVLYWSGVGGSVGIGVSLGGGGGGRSGVGVVVRVGVGEAVALRTVGRLGYGIGVGSYSMGLKMGAMAAARLIVNSTPRMTIGV